MKVAVIFFLFFFLQFSFLHAEDSNNKASQDQVNQEALKYVEVPIDVAFPDQPEPAGPPTKKMFGGIRAVNAETNSLSFVPDNVGDPIEVTCKQQTPECTVSSTMQGNDRTLEVYLENGKWYAKSIQ